ncbi:putative efflux pump antibiotic resistance protein [Xylariaceae sp. FL1019]|nr:putative efflux pump antibiotic resistance protein [Xylariaceae sp. FL1019]
MASESSLANTSRDGFDDNLGGSPTAENAVKLSGEHLSATDEKTPATGVQSHQDDKTYLRGPRFWMISSIIGILFFIVHVEISIVTTTLVVIASDIGGFELASWILTSYLIGYVGVIVMFAKLSDIFGRKIIYTICIFIFTVFSGACGAAQSTTQLIILRAFQGVGGGGCFSMSTVFLIELVPPHKYAKFVAFAGISIALALTSGPILGGAISTNTTWRWIFLINVPIGAFALLLAILGIPNGFPFHDQPHRQLKNTLSRGNLARVDILGSSLLLLATLSLTAGFQEADLRFPWRSAYVITLITVSGLLWIALFTWERQVTKAEGVIEPVFPWRFVTDRVVVGVYIGFILLGGPMTVTNFQLPQRFQLVNHLSALDAGVRVVPFGGAIPIGTILAANILNKTKTPPIFIVLAGAVLQVIGFALMATLPYTPYIPAKMYGFQILAGFGAGANYQTLYLMIPFVVQPRDRAVGVGSANQFRMMGSAFGLAIATTVFNGYALPSLRALGIEDYDAVINGQHTASFVDGGSDDAYRRVLAEAYDRQLIVLAVLAAAQIPVAFLMWKKRQVVLG